jgi:hypothetical protein
MAQLLSSKYRNRNRKNTALDLIARSLVLRTSNASIRSWRGFSAEQCAAKHFHRRSRRPKSSAIVKAVRPARCCRRATCYQRY